MVVERWDCILFLRWDHDLAGMNRMGWVVRQSKGVLLEMLDILPWEFEVQSCWDDVGWVLGTFAGSLDSGKRLGGPAYLV